MLCKLNIINPQSLQLSCVSISSPPNNDEASLAAYVRFNFPTATRTNTQRWNRRNYVLLDVSFKMMQYFLSKCYRFLSLIGGEILQEGPAFITHAHFVLLFPEISRNVSLNYLHL